MIEQALYDHLKYQKALKPFLAEHDDEMAIFNQEAPDDEDELWGCGPQYGRIVFAEEIDGDPARTMGGTLVVDIMCSEEGEEVHTPEEIEPIVRNLIHGWFFSNGTFTVAAQHKKSLYFSEPTKKVIGCTLTFALLGFPVLSTCDLDVIGRLNEWTHNHYERLHVINHCPLPDTAWKPRMGEAAIYWRVAQEKPAGWIPDTFQTVWRTATIKGHIFAEDISTASTIARRIRTRLYADKRLLKAGESPIMVNQNNSMDDGADPLRTGQVTVEATFGVIVYFESSETLENINYE